jgi:predicted RNA-binding protein
MSSIAKYALDNPNAIKDMCKDIRKAIKTAATKAVNATAFEARENLKTYVQENFNNPTGLVTGKALFVTKAAFGHTENLGDIHASVGFSEKVDFMKRQDEGGWHTAKEPAKKLKILTDAAKQNGLPTAHIGKRGKITTRGKVIHTILLKRPKQESHKAARVARAAMAYKTGLLMYLGPNNSMFKVTAFEKIGDEGIRFDTEMYVNRKFEKTYTRARNFFLPECKKALAHIQDLFNENMNKDMNNS